MAGIVVSAGVTVLNAIHLTERQAARAAAVLGAEGDADWVRRRQSGRDRRLPAVVAATLAGAAALVITVAIAAGSISNSDRDATGQVPEKGPVSVYELRSGDCLNGIEDVEAEVRAVEAVPCGQPHEGEVVASFQVPDGEYPGPDAITRRAERRCGTAVLDATRPRRNGPRLFPTRQSWSVGDREILCIGVHNKPVRGTLR